MANNRVYCFLFWICRAAQTQKNILPRILSINLEWIVWTLLLLDTVCFQSSNSSMKFISLPINMNYLIAYKQTGLRQKSIWDSFWNALTFCWAANLSRSGRDKKTASIVYTCSHISSNLLQNYTKAKSVISSPYINKWSSWRSCLLLVFLPVPYKMTRVI